MCACLYTLTFSIPSPQASGREKAASVSVNIYSGHWQSRKNPRLSENTLQRLSEAQGDTQSPYTPQVPAKARGERERERKRGRGQREKVRGKDGGERRERERECL